MSSIVRTDDVLGGEPRIEGSRVGVIDVYELVVEGGYSPADVADQLDRSLGDIYTALAYYYEHVEEMRTLRQERSETESTLATDALQPPELVQ
ncbi:DUF433 domain-containing protein [Halapricum desulfuricans]|uniref:Putative antitoxin of wHTH fold n=1 Tax=Halapricum desulfuricans TaxID=2841257 RepID=A0A897MWY1_9EURY|nr:DUF433 domain-containing protein [Halapricum desulfuricans]QSG05092.1 putative antitoxin of wHTH fold [Halapricum desulfuricans]